MSVRLNKIGNIQQLQFLHGDVILTTADCVFDAGQAFKGQFRPHAKKISSTLFNDVQVSQHTHTATTGMGVPVDHYCAYAFDLPFFDNDRLDMNILVGIQSQIVVPVAVNEIPPIIEHWIGYSNSQTSDAFLSVIPLPLDDLTSDSVKQFASRAFIERTIGLDPQQSASGAANYHAYFGTTIYSPQNTNFTCETIRHFFTSNALKSNREVYDPVIS